MAANSEGDSSPDGKPCFVCGKVLRPEFGNWEHYQPSGGGEVQFIFAYGSAEFDLDMGNTVFRGVICDECGKRLFHRMDRD